MKISPKAGALGGALLLSIATTSAPVLARDLTIVGWGGTNQDAQRLLFFQPFAEKLGKPVLEDSWDGGYGVLQAKVMAGSPNWDVVQVESDELYLGCYDGLYEQIDWDRIGDPDDFVEGAVHECGVGTLIASTGIAYDADKLPEGPVDWVDFWDTEKFPGKRALRKGPKFTLEFALLGDGVSPDELYDVLSTPEGVDRAFAKLEELGSDLLWWETGGQPLQYLASGEVTMTAAYNGRITNANREQGTNLAFVWPGNIYTLDSWVVLKGSENVEAGMDFIAFFSQPELQAQMPEYSAYGLPNRLAADLVPAEFEADLPTYPANMEHAIQVDTDFWIDNNEELNERFNAWLSVQ